MLASFLGPVSERVCRKNIKLLGGRGVLLNGLQDGALDFCLYLTSCRRTNDKVWREDEGAG